jgi:hypothetical protein
LERIGDPTDFSDEAEFKAVIRALLSTAPMPASAIEDKRTRKADAKRPGPKKRT